MSTMDLRALLTDVEDNTASVGNDGCLYGGVLLIFSERALG